jgi:hypothetical protein
MNFTIRYMNGDAATLRETCEETWMERRIAGDLCGGYMPAGHDSPPSAMPMLRAEF